MSQRRLAPAWSRWDFQLSRGPARRSLDPQPQSSTSVDNASVKKPAPSAESAPSNQWIYPTHWVSEERALARRYLDLALPTLRQAILDEVIGRLKAVAGGASPLFNELRYLKRLCDRAAVGEFEANLGIRIRIEREARRNRTTHQPPQPAPRVDRDKQIAIAARALAQVRSTLSKSNKTGS